MVRSRLVAALAAAAAAVTVSTVAWAAIPDANGVIHACVKASGQIRIVDTDAGQACADNEQSVSWSQTGPAGPPGPAGTALAYAHVAADGSVTDSKNVDSVVTPGSGAYCFDLDVRVGNVQVQMDRASTGDDVRVGAVAQIPAPPPAFGISLCGADHSDAFVNVLRAIEGGSSPEAHAFYVLFN